MRATLGEFLRIGRLGGIQTGASRADVRFRLGAPRLTAPGLWAYDALEIRFDRDRVRTLALRFDCPVPPRLRLDGWRPTRDTTLAVFQRYLADERIPFRMSIPTDRRIALSVGGGAAVAFALEGTHTSLDRIDAAFRPPTAL